MTNLTIGVLHPGDMGSTVGASARANVSRVLWASEERSAQTAERAGAAGLEGHLVPGNALAHAHPLRVGALGQVHRVDLDQVP